MNGCKHELTFFHINKGIVCVKCGATNTHWIKPTKNSCPRCGEKVNYKKEYRCACCGYWRKHNAN